MHKITIIEPLYIFIYMSGSRYNNKKNFLIVIVTALLANETGKMVGVFEKMGLFYSNCVAQAEKAVNFTPGKKKLLCTCMIEVSFNWLQLNGMLMIILMSTWQKKVVEIPYHI